MRTIAVIDRRIAVRVVFADYIADDPRGFLVRLVVVVTELPHGVQDASVNRLQAIADIGQGTADDDAHRIVQVGLLHLLFEAYRQDLLSNVRHTISHCQSGPEILGIAANKIRLEIEVL
jgi:hypothetical protein